MARDGFWNRKKVAVTGGAGFIGSHVVEELLRRGAEKVIVYDDLSRGSPANLQAADKSRLWMDLADLSSSTWAFPQGLGAVFHLAAKVTGIQYNTEHHFDMLTTNLKINTNVIEQAAAVGPGVFVAVSTACIYGHDVPVPTPESYGIVCDPEPTNWGYGVAKWVLEQQARFLRQEMRVPTVVVRFFNAAGVNDYYDPETSHVAPALIKRVLDGEDPIVVWGTGTQTRALVDARDIARALVDLAEEERAWDARPVNIGHEREVSIRELAETILRLSGKQADLFFDTSRPDGYPRRAAATERLRELIGWVPSTPLETTLADMIADYKRRYKEG